MRKLTQLLEPYDQHTISRCIQHQCRSAGRSKPRRALPTVRKALTISIYCPSFRIAFRFLLIPRIIAASTAIITDCDEVFSYYEPAHYLVHRWGFQTWEYDPNFAIRSWVYIIPHALIIAIGELITKHKVAAGASL